MRAASVLALLVLVLTLSACASITAGSTQPVTVTAVCDGAIVPSAQCTLVNDKGRWEVVARSPVVVQKSYADLAVACRHGTAQGSATFVSKPNGGAWGNIIAGGLIGYAVDSGTGAGFNYPQEMAVVMYGTCPAPQ